MSVEAARKDPFGLVGSVLDGRFLIEREVAEGGFGVVYYAIQVALDRPVAIKVLKTPADFDEMAKVQFRDRFASEAKTIARIRHPHIVDVYDFGISPMPSGEIAPWMALEWLQGETLEDELQRRRGQGGQKPADVLAVFRPVLQAFAFAHKQGIAHRDIKPANIMAVPSEHGVTMQVLDFGIAKVANPDQIAGSGYSRTSSMPAFSPLYAAPEQIAFGRTGYWTDVHALGLILTEMLTDQPPYTAEDKELFEEVMSHRRPTPAAKGIDVGTWEPVLQRAVALSPSDRWKTASELLAALAANLDQPTSGVVLGGVAVKPTGPKKNLELEKVAPGPVPPLPAYQPFDNRTPATRTKRSKLVWSGAGGAIVVSVAIVGVLGLRGHHAPFKEPPQAAKARPDPLVPPLAFHVTPLPQPASSPPGKEEASISDSPKLLGTLIVGHRQSAALSDSTKPSPNSTIGRREIREPMSPKATRNQNDEHSESGAECTMSINSVPWAEVWIDGRTTSEHTPVVDYKIPCGRHRLAFKRPDMHLDQGKDVSLKPGRTFKQLFVLGAPSGIPDSESPTPTKPWVDPFAEQAPSGTPDSERPTPRSVVDTTAHHKPPARPSPPASTGYRGSTLKIETQFP